MKEQIFGVVGVISETAQEARVVEVTMSTMLDFIREQGIDVYLRRDVTTSTDKDMETDRLRIKTTFRAALAPNPEGGSGQIVRVSSNYSAVLE